MNKYEIITFQDNTFKLDVNVSPSEDTVWLTQMQIAKLFDTTKNNISMHVRNIFKEKEQDISVVKKSLTTGLDGKIYKTKFYNLDMILSIGYRVKSKRGNIFRIWANSVLKQFMLNKTDDCKECKQHIINLDNKVQN